MLENPSYSKPLLEKINSYGITLESQESKIEENPFIHDDFITQNSETIKNLSECKAVQHSQLPYLQIVMPKKLGYSIFKELFNSKDICIEIQIGLYNFESNPSIYELRDKHRAKFNIDGINLTNVEFKNPENNKTIYTPYSNHWFQIDSLYDNWGDCDDCDDCDEEIYDLSFLMLIGSSHSITFNSMVQEMLTIITKLKNDDTSN